VAGFKSPSSPAAALGQRVHDVLEHYLRDGKPFDFTTLEGNIAASGIEYLPQPRAPGLLCEGEFDFPGPWEHEYKGRIDFRLPGVIGDHKTSKDIAKWQKQEADLLHDEQAIIYSAFYFWKNPDEVDVTNRWIYYATGQTRKSALTELKITQEHAFNELQKIEETACEIAALHQHLTTEVPGPKEKLPLAIPLTKKMLEHCSAYGGCGFAGQCNIGPMERMKGFLAKDKETRMNLLKKAPVQSATAVGAVVPAQINPPEQHLPPKVTDAPALEAQAAASAPPTSPAGPAPEVGGLMARVKANLGQVAAQAAVDTSAAVADVPPETTPAVPELGQHTAAEARAVAAGKKRGRPPGAKNKPPAEAPAPVPGAPAATFTQAIPLRPATSAAGGTVKSREDRITEALEALVDEVRSLRLILKGRS